MKFTLSWLKDHLDTTASLDEITYALTDLGLEVEGVEDRGQAAGLYHRLRQISGKTPGRGPPQGLSGGDR